MLEMHLYKWSSDKGTTQSTNFIDKFSSHLLYMQCAILVSSYNMTDSSHITWYIGLVHSVDVLI